MKEKTSLEKSHSKSSNFKLTFICFLAALSVSLLWVGVSLIFKDNFKTFGIILTIASGVFTLFTIVLLNKFSRG